jgi:peptide-methionine (R)-S-oxide reductase
MRTWIIIAALLSTSACSGQEKQHTMANQTSFPIQKTEAEWKAELGEERYRILRQAGTERPFSGTYNMHFQEGIYSCGGCGAPLFESSSKFDGHCGWPSFDREIEEGKILERKDMSHGMVRTEILCAQCGGHLGHVFDDGPTETGLRYCVNSLSINFQEKK